MLMDYELHVAVSTKIAELVQTSELTNLDLIVMQDDKYRNTVYEEIVYGIGSSKGLKKEEYYFNAIEADPSTPCGKIADQYYNEPVYYYEELQQLGKITGGAIMYEVRVQPLQRQIRVYSVGYTGRQVVRTPLETILLGNSKFYNKRIVKEVA